MIHQPATAAAEWWRRLQPYRADGTRNPYGDRGALARFRRATVARAMSEPATFTLFGELRCTERRDLENVALCASLLASVRKNERGVHPARALGPKPGGGAETAIMSPLRFRALVEATDSEDRLTALRRAVALAGGTINVRYLAGACLDWSEGTRRTWIFNYYNAASAAPDVDQTGNEDIIP